MKASLEGVRVVEIAHFVAVPAAGSLLADLGADVIKVEAPPHGEIYRRSRPILSGMKSDFPEGPGFHLDNRGKRSCWTSPIPDARSALLRGDRHGPTGRPCPGPRATGSARRPSLLRAVHARRERRSARREDGAGVREAQPGRVAEAARHRRAHLVTGEPRRRGARRLRRPARWPTSSRSTTRRRGASRASPRHFVFGRRGSSARAEPVSSAGADGEAVLREAGLDESKIAKLCGA